VENLLDLPLELLRELVGILQIEEVLPDGFLEGQSPKVEQRLVDVDESPVAVERVGEVGDCG
jgi:hypothetical protein